MIPKLIKNWNRERRSPKNAQLDNPLESRISDLCLPLFGLCEYAVKHQSREADTYPALLLRLHKESTTIEELVDNCGAQKNEKWYPFREAVAAVKLFTSTCYNLLHIRDALPRYKLIEVEGSFYRDTKKTVDELMEAVVSAARILIFQAKRCGVFRTGDSAKIEIKSPAPLSLRFPADRNVRHVRKTGGTVVYLSTAFLNLSKDRDVSDILRVRDTNNYSMCIPEAVNEENIRIAELRFHNLQSHYDTYIFESDLESQNRNLPILRGHISVIYHLLQVGTDLAHYYERHMSDLRRRMVGKSRFPLSKPVLLHILFVYILGYSKFYMDSANNLCRSMIQSYSEKREIEVEIPNYRGFHVRPSTLVAKIVAHYGSSITMIIDDQEYNAGVTFDLFRANEKINAMKRGHIGDILKKVLDPTQLATYGRNELKEKLQVLFLELTNDRRIILYDTNLPFDEFKPSEDETMTSLAFRYIRHYMSVSRIDIDCDLTAIFKGDNRALIDLKLLAESGYGEDKYGNNVLLPKELSYLRM